MVVSLGLGACAHKSVLGPHEEVQYVELYEKTQHTTPDGESVEVTWY